MIHTPDTRIVDIRDHIWSDVWTKDEPFVMTDYWGRTVKLHKGQKKIHVAQHDYLWAIRHFDRTLYGGAGGPGKSYIGAWGCADLAWEWVAKEYNYNWSLGMPRVINLGIICMTKKQAELRHAVKFPERFPAWMGHYYPSKHLYKFNPKIFGEVNLHLLNFEEPDLLKSMEFWHLFFDELTECEDPNDFYKLQPLLRIPIEEVKPSLGCASNPDGPGNPWVDKEFGCTDPSTRRGPGIDPMFKLPFRGSCFIKALPSSSPYLAPDYYVQLNQNPSRLIREARLLGLWKLSEGLYYDNLNSEVHRIPRFEIRANIPLYIVCDTATSHTSACVVMAYFHPTPEYPKGRLIVIDEYCVYTRYISEFKKGVWKMLAAKGYRNVQYGICDPAMEAFKGTTIGERSPIDVLNAKDQYGPSLNLVPARKPHNDRIQGHAAVLEALHYIEEDGVIIEQPFLQFFDDVPYVWAEMGNARKDPDKFGDVLKPTIQNYGPGEGDDARDCVRYGIMMISPYAPRKPLPEEIDPAQQEYEDYKRNFETQRDSRLYTDHDYIDRSANF